MKLGTSTVNLYRVIVDNKETEVIKVEKCGDNFGYVQCVNSEKVFSTYGYNSLVKIGHITIESRIA